MSKKVGGRNGLGWFSAGMLCMLLSSPTWGLDLDQQIQKAEAESAQILGTLGRHKAPAKAVGGAASRQVQVKLIAKSQARKRR